MENQNFEQMQKINVDLYETGDNKTPAEADYIFCDQYKKCTFYQEGKCLRVRSLPFSTCKFGKNNVVKGYTRRAKKYYDFCAKAKNDETYNKLKYPCDRVALINGYLYMKLKYVDVRKITDKTEMWKAVFNGYEINNGHSFFGVPGVFLPIDDVADELLYKIFTYKPRSIWGWTADGYQDKIVPDIIQGLKKVAPKIYNDFIEKHPEFDKEPDYIGKWAYLSTLADGCTILDCHGNEFYKKDGKFYCDNMTRGFTPLDGVAKVEVIPTEEKVFKITSNSQVDENTRFE